MQVIHFSATAPPVWIIYWPPLIPSVLRCISGRLTADVLRNQSFAAGMVALGLGRNKLLTPTSQLGFALEYNAAFL